MNIIKIVKRILVLVVILLALAWLLNMLGLVSAEEAKDQCPAGSYDIGITKDDQTLCRLEPTGCPYGDSIPMSECDKFKPEEIEITNLFEVHEEVPMAEPVLETQGK